MFEGGFYSNWKPTGTVFESPAAAIKLTASQQALSLSLSVSFENIRKMRTCFLMLFISFHQPICNHGVTVQNSQRGESDVEAGRRTQPQQWRSTSVCVGAR